MGRRELIVLFACVCLLASFVVYVISETNLLTGGTGGEPTPTPSPTPSTSPSPSPTPTPSTSPSPSPTPTPTTSPSPTPSPTLTPSPSPSPSPTPPPEDPNVNAEDHEDPADYEWNSIDVIDITLNGNSITVNPAGAATVDGSKVTITSAANYRITGSLTDGQVIVDTNDTETVRLILNGVNINCFTSSPIYIEDAKKVIVVLQAGTANYVADGVSYVLEVGEDEPNAAVFSKSDLTIYGDGSLDVDANYNDGVASKDGLIIKSGTITVNSVDDGIRGKDYLVVKGGVVTLDVGGDGLKSDNVDDFSMGYVSVEAGAVTVVADGDAISAETDVIVISGDLTLTSGGGSSAILGSGVSAKGLKAGVSVIINAGTFVVNSADDAVHSNANMTINGGSFTVSTGDDGFHADIHLEINGGDINITKCNEGIESAVITINDGNIHLTSSDDGINVAGDDDPFVMEPQVTYSGNQFLYINGGYIYVDALGDGLDVNGGAVMTGGVVIVNGPIEDINGALDSASFNMTGGFLVAVGSSGMAQATSTSSTQCSVLVEFTDDGGFWTHTLTHSAGTLVRIQTSAGADVVTFAPTKQYSSIAFSSPALTMGSTYKIYYGGSLTGGTVTDGLYTGGTYTPGTEYDSFTISSMVTKIGGGGGWGGFP
jgi:hypothetical protein